MSRVRHCMRLVRTLSVGEGASMGIDGGRCWAIGCPGVMVIGVESVVALVRSSKLYRHKKN